MVEKNIVNPIHLNRSDFLQIHLEDILKFFIYEGNRSACMLLLPPTIAPKRDYSRSNYTSTQTEREGEGGGWRERERGVLRPSE